MEQHEHLFDDRTISLLTGDKFNALMPLPTFKGFAKQHGGVLTDNPKFYRPLYPDFDDFDYRHDTSTIAPIYLNDYDFCLEEDRQKIADLIRMDFDAETFDTVASCQCGKLRGNYFISSRKVCNSCGSEVERLVDSTLETKVWLRLPEGVKAFINPGFYKTFFDSLGTTSPKLNIVEVILSSTYRRQMKVNHTESGRRLLHELESIGMELNLNSFVSNCDMFMNHFLLGEGRKLTNLSAASSEEMHRLYLKYKHIIFTNYLPVPNRFATIIERNGDDKQAMASQLKISNVYQSIADTKDTTEYYQTTAEDIAKNIDIVGKAIISLARFNSENLKGAVFQKPSLIRKHVIAGSLPFSGRGIITSTTGIHDAGLAKIPRVMMIAMLKKFLKSHLYRHGYTPLKANALIAHAAYNVTPIIDDFIRKAEKEKRIVGVLGRNPIIQYLSIRTFFFEMNEDITDESINLPILSVSPFNAKVIGPLSVKTLMRTLFNCLKSLKLVDLLKGVERQNSYKMPYANQ